MEYLLVNSRAYTLLVRISISRTIPGEEILSGGTLARV